MNIAIIPARGGSKRIPRKNIKLFYGKPMIAYSIEAALESGCFDKIIVSTDDNEIAGIARQYGAQVPFIRPAKIADDYATTLDVIAHALKWCADDGMVITNACCIYATAPFISASSLKEGLAALSDETVCYAFSATSYAFPIQRAIKIDKECRVDMFQPEYLNTRSQDLEEAYHDAGQFYWGKAQVFLEKRAIFDSNSKAVLLPRKRVQDIDTQEDWELAEALYRVIEC
ncbi:pseudaminic acid cytidylyltransferase [Marinomonas mediterranea]|jgi:pseudaminic acid CMP-transferase|uniref:Pseudaminic acid CMP-transferase n=1 Tax=Marinomonas mediterranea (strain ATCC 700492 / JCM 21426 / NBRC 103028 / MMB-1) TaxID=717774 RepID=F2K159_MARM1|nr:pseudaminic acid cytidylyltransferase [Marinomonas mediterranea]ADZ89909.1 pseudaminic acid CMP-transferase [Marinomonas mediterranea MMB-1]WCN07993.1 pseudaminic acid cytidylyltransferase [Marinomonas mediterranea]WCN12088.1 pseudaminic acid cytidylyltransferase [Marinomonas mediterranea]WCN16126.1 pseudaminic acid cytidylyltransferase [Marinomonas mediterranea MMB-1]